MTQQADGVLKVVVGVDGADEARRALAWGFREAGLRGVGTAVRYGHPAESLVVGAGTDGPPAAGSRGLGSLRGRLSGSVGQQPPWAVPDATLREEAASALRRSVRDAGLDGGPGLRVRAEATRGVDWDVLLDVAEGADLLVVGSRGRSGWTARLLGSVALHCVTAAPCPVAVVRPPRDRRPSRARGGTAG
jgi:nucleotide-binding universal stress UspA family protein